MYYTLCTIYMYYIYPLGKLYIVVLKILQFACHEILKNAHVIQRKARRKTEIGNMGNK